MANPNEEELGILLDSLNQAVAKLPIERCWIYFCLISDASSHLVTVGNKLANLAMYVHQPTWATALLQENFTELLTKYAQESTLHFSIVIQAILEKNPHAFIQLMLQKQGVEVNADEASVSSNHATAKDLILNPQQAQLLTGMEQSTGLCIGPLDVLTIIEERASHHGKPFPVADVFVSDSTNTHGSGKKVGVLYSSGEVRWDKDGSYSEPLVTVSNIALH